MHHACDRLSWQRFGARFARAGRDEFETRLAQTGGLGALQLLDGVVQTPRRLETSTLRETISQKTQEGRESKLLRGPPTRPHSSFLAARRCASKPHYKLRASRARKTRQRIKS